MTEVTLEFISHQIERLLRDNADMRERLMLIESQLSHVVVLVDSLHRRLDRMNDRIRKLEDV